LNAEFFRSFGLYIVRDFLDADLCARLRSETRSAMGIPATIRTRGAEYVVDEEVRRTKIAEVSEANVALLEQRLLAVKPTVETHFEVVTAGCRRPQFLVYREGDFFGPHADNSREPDAPEIATGRRVSMVVFLNGEGEEREEDSYAGGSLTFYGLMDDPRARKYGFSLTAETGLLVAFRPEWVHAVTPVSRGIRYTVVSWLEGAGARDGTAVRAATRQ
jgi:SM-20-related protein